MADSTVEDELSEEGLLTNVAYWRGRVKRLRAELDVAQDDYILALSRLVGYREGKRNEVSPES